MPKKWSVRRSPNFGPSLLANPVYGLQCSRNVCRAIKLKLHIVRDVIKTRAELVNAECKIWILEVYVLNLYASIPRQLYSVVAKKYFFYKVLYWFVSVYKSMPFVVEFSCKFCTTMPSWLLILDQNCTPSYSPIHTQCDGCNDSHVQTDKHCQSPADTQAASVQTRHQHVGQNTWRLLVRQWADVEVADQALQSSSSFDQTAQHSNDLSSHTTEPNNSLTHYMHW